MPNHSPRILLLTPPLTQLNTPYPATAYIKGFLAGRGYAVTQADMGLQLVLRLFSAGGLRRVFQEIEAGDFNLGEFRGYLEIELADILAQRRGCGLAIHKACGVHGAIVIDRPVFRCLSSACPLLGTIRFPALEQQRVAHQ